jgi:hypothetical protein
MITGEYQHATEERTGYKIWTGTITTEWTILKAGAVL